MTLASFWRSDPAAALRGLEKRRRPAALLAPVELVEGGDGEVDLAPDLDDLWGLPGRQGELGRDGAERAHVGGHVLAHPPVAACRAAHEAAPLVGERDREAVDLRLADKGRPVPGRQSSRFRRAPQARISSRVVTLSRLIIGVRWVTGAKSAPGVIRPSGWASRSRRARGGLPRARPARLLGGRRWHLGLRGVLEVVLGVVAPDEGPQLGDPRRRPTCSLSSLATLRWSGNPQAAVAEPTTRRPGTRRRSGRARPVGPVLQVGHAGPRHGATGLARPWALAWARRGAPSASGSPTQVQPVSSTWSV